MAYNMTTYTIIDKLETIKRQLENGKSHVGITQLSQLIQELKEDIY